MMLTLKCVKSVPSVIIYVLRCMFFLPRVCRLINRDPPCVGLQYV